MKGLSPVFGVPSITVASGEVTALAAIFLAVFILLLGFCYLLITRTEVAPHISLTKRGLKLRFKRLPARGEGPPDDDGQGQA